MSRDGRTITSAYDADDRLTTQVWLNSSGTATNTLTYAYDADSDLTVAANNAGTYTMSYDKLGDMTVEAEPFGATLTMAYDAVGNRTQVADSFGGVTTSTYDADDRLTEREFSNGTTPLSFDMTYTSRSQLASVTRYNSLTQNGSTEVGSSAYTYNAEGLLTNLQHNSGTASGGNLFNTTYSYDLNDRLTGIAQAGSSAVTYTYNALNELTGDTSSATPTYSYDANGNRTNPGDTVGTDNQISTDGTWTYTYDKEGNVTEKTDAAGDKWQYTYDNMNELVGATYTPTGTTVASTICTYVYDVFGDKIEQEETVSGVTTITKFAYDGSNIWAAMSSSNALQTRYVYMDGSTTPVAQVSSSGTVNWYDTDYEGSVRVVTNNSTGAAVDTITYDAYGNIRSQSAPVSGQFAFYAGGVYDSALGFVLFVDHWYNPVTGSWMQQDELFPESGVNPYEYGGNDPSNEIDPTGLDDGPVPGEVIIYPGQTTVSPNGPGQGVPGEAIIGAGRNVVTVGPDAVVVSNMPQPPAPGFWESAVNRYWAGVKYDVASLASALERDWRNFKNDPGGYLLRSLNPLPLLEAVGRTVENGINNLYPSMVDLVEQLGENPGGVAGEFAWEFHKAWAFWIFGEWAFGGEVPCPKQGAAVVEDGAAAANVAKKLRPHSEVLGKSEGGPGQWVKSPKRSGGEAFQEGVSGVERGVEYEVNGIKFDGYDPSTNTLLDAKDWVNYPPPNTTFWHQSVLKEAADQLRVARGVPIEWRFSQQASADAVAALFEARGITGITIVGPR